MPTNEFEADCMKWRGRLLTGQFAHWCSAWDLLPVDETCLEWPCACARDLRSAQRKALALPLRQGQGEAPDHAE